MSRNNIMSAKAINNENIGNRIIMNNKEVIK